MSIRLIRGNLLVMAAIMLGIQLFYFLLFFIRQDYGAYASQADLWLLEGGMTYRLFFFFPLLGIMYHNIFQKTSGINWKIRYGGEWSLAKEQIKLGCLSAGVLIMIECASMVFLCTASGLPAMNWQSETSMFCYRNWFTLDSSILEVIIYYLILRLTTVVLLWITQRFCWKHGGKLWLWYLVVLVTGELEIKFPWLPLLFRSTNLDINLIEQPTLWIWKGLVFVGMVIIYVWLEKRNI